EVAAPTPTECKSPPTVFLMRPKSVALSINKGMGSPPHHSPPYAPFMASCSSFSFVKKVVFEGASRGTLFSSFWHEELMNITNINPKKYRFKYFMISFSVYRLKIQINAKRIYLSNREEAASCTIGYIRRHAGRHIVQSGE